MIEALEDGIVGGGMAGCLPASRLREVAMRRS
ncbi:hypothetical protein BH23PSE1_BH23PSE1_00280 [soil metagenome]